MSLQPLSAIVRTAAVFSLSVIVNGAALGSFSELKLTRACDGIGLSGVCTSQLSFSVPRSAFVEIADTRAAPVNFSVYGDNVDIVSSTFYIDKRSCKNGIITFTCLDRMAFADGVSFSPDDFEEEVESVNSWELIRLCAKKLKLNPDTAAAHGGAWTFRVPLDNIVGSTVAQVLTQLSEVVCGYFCIDNNDALIFNAYGYYVPVVGTIEDCSAVDVNIPCNITGYRLADSSDNVYMYGDDSGMLAEASAPYATQDIANAVGAYVTAADEYVAAACDNCLINFIPELGYKLRFGGGHDIIAHNIDLTISGNGIYGSISAPEYSNGEITDHMGRISRRLEQAVKTGDIIGNNVLITKYQGLQFVPQEG